MLPCKEVTDTVVVGAVSLTTSRTFWGLSSSSRVQASPLVVARLLVTGRTRFTTLIQLDSTYPLVAAHYQVTRIAFFARFATLIHPGGITRRSGACSCCGGIGTQ